MYLVRTYLCPRVKEGLWLQIPTVKGFVIRGSKAAVIGDGGGWYVTPSTARRGLSFKRTKITRGRG